MWNSTQNGTQRVQNPPDIVNGQSQGAQGNVTTTMGIPQFA